MTTHIKKKYFNILFEKFFITIYYEDTDFTGYVYHANYLKFFERAREEAFGIHLIKNLYLENMHFVVSEANLKFIRPTQHGQKISIESTLTISTKPRLIFKQIAFDDNSKMLVTSHIELVLVNKKGVPIRIPEKVLHNITENSRAKKL